MGKELYLLKCAQCHGKKGDGKGIAASYFRPAPRDFTSAVYKFRTTESGELPTDSDIRKSIKNGMPFTGMPAWPDLTEEELTNLVYYLKTFAEDFAGPYADVTPLKIPKSPKYSKSSAQRGKDVYEENQCYDCHGNLGRGDGESAQSLTDQWDEHIKPADLTMRWMFKGGSTREDIFRTFMTGLDGSPMPSYSIDPEDQWALVDYVYSLSKDEAKFATYVVAKGTTEEIDLSKGKSIFDGIEAALFPVVGQIMEADREYFPGINAIEVKAIHNETDIAILLSWHDMSAERSGTNHPSIIAPEYNQKIEEPEQEFNSEFSDAVAIQLPAELSNDIVKPYFVFGDPQNPVGLWFVDLAKNEPEVFVAKGSQNIQSYDGKKFYFQADYDEGEWIALFKSSKISGDILYFKEQTFIPISFSVWDGFNKERGNQRGITSWYYIYLEPLESESAATPMVKYGLITFLLEIGIVFFIRKKYKEKN
jgi:mono/diheme cytochrome c family protein